MTPLTIVGRSEPLGQMLSELIFSAESLGKSEMVRVRFDGATSKQLYGITEDARALCAQFMHSVCQVELIVKP